MIVNVILWIAVAVAGILVCAIAAATEPEGKTTTYVPKFSTFNSANNCDSSANSPATQIITSKENCEHMQNVWNSMEIDKVHVNP